MYQEELLDHFHHPRHRGTLANPAIHSGRHNPSCGDSVIMQADVENGQIHAIAFQGSGCVISQAAASMLAVYALHKTPEFMLRFTQDDLIQLIKIPLGPTRLKCALLCLHALQEGIKQYMQNNG